MLQLLQQVTPATFADVLRVLAANTDIRGGQQLLARALEHDRGHVHLLHPTADDSTGQQQGTAAAAAGMHGATEGALRQQQQQRYAAALLTELLHIAVASGSAEGLHMLCTTPYANSLGEREVLS
jgi:hypothetical protein